MTLTGADVLPVKCQSVEAVRESLQEMWETCLPRRKRLAAKPSALASTQYFVPDLTNPVFLRKRKEDVMTESHLLRLKREAEAAERRGRASSRPARSLTTHEVLHWRTEREAAPHGRWLTSTRTRT